MSSEANQETQEVQKNFSWQGSISDLTSFNTYGVVTLSNGKKANVQVTLRHGLAPDKAYNDFKNFVALLDLMAQDHEVEFWDGVRKYDNGSNGKTETGAAGSSGSNGGSKRNYKDPIPQAELPAELAETNVDVYAAEFDYIVIKPDLDEKSVVEFWKDDLKFAVGAKMNKWKHDTIVDRLASLEIKNLDPSKPSKTRVAGVQYWSKGNEYTYERDGQTRTTNYKDLLLVKPAF